MKKNRLLVLLLAFVMAFSVFALAACGDDNEPGGDGTTLTLSTTALSIKEEESKQITVTYNGTGTLTYTVDKTDIATVAKDATDQKKATVTGVKAGTATLTVSDGTLTKTCAVTVTEKEAPAVTLTLSDTSVSIEEESTKQITATYDGTGTLTYTIDNTDIATVAKDANDQKKATITAVKAGTATLTVSDGTISKTCSITVVGETVVIKNGENAISKLYLKATGENATATLTAESSKGSAVSWTSSNTEVATVSDGAVNAVAEGYTVITAKVNDDVKAEISLWVTPEDYDITLGEEGTGDDGEQFVKVVNHPDKWYVWTDLNYWTGATITECNAAFANNAATATYKALGVSEKGVQFFYDYADIEAWTAHELTLTLCSAKAMTAVVNNTEVELVANTPKTVTVKYVEGTDIISIIVKFPVHEISSGNAETNTVSVSDVIIKALPQTKLTAPTLALDDENTVTITEIDDEEELALVGGYQIGLFNGETLVKIFNVEDGDTLDLRQIEDGTYTAKIRAYPDNDYLLDYTISDWSEAGVTIVWENNTAPAIENNGTTADSNAAKTAGNENKWFLYHYTVNLLEGSSTNGEALDTAITIDYTGGGEFWIVQLFRKITEINGEAIDSAKSYKLSFDIVATFAGEAETDVIQVNGNNISLDKGVSKHVEHTWAAGAEMFISIAFGNPSNNKALPGKYELTNITLVEVTEEAEA